MRRSKAIESLNRRLTWLKEKRYHNSWDLQEIGAIEYALNKIGEDDEAVQQV